jgi:hypothetical protein
MGPNKSPDLLLIMFASSPILTSAFDARRENQVSAFLQYMNGPCPRLDAKRELISQSRATARRTATMLQKMAFSPSREKASLFAQWSHTENFGVWEETKFGRNHSSLVAQVRFTAKIARVMSLPGFSFWPFVTLKDHAFPGCAQLYSLLRRAQCWINHLERTMQSRQSGKSRPFHAQ